MDKRKKRRLGKRGWRFGSAADFLELSQAEDELVEIKLRLAAGLKTIRRKRGVTQAALARAAGSSQSRVAKMEAGEHMVSIDLLVRTLLTLGTSPKEVAEIISGAGAESGAG